MNAVRGWSSVLLLCLSPWVLSLAQRGRAPAEKSPAPQLVAWVNYLAEGLFIHATGEPGTEARFQIRQVELEPAENQGSTGTLSFPIQFDASGVWYQILPLLGLASEVPKTYEFWITQDLPAPAQDLVSIEWRLDTGCVAASTPGLENPPAGGLSMLPRPGTMVPLHPVSWAVLPAPGLLLEGSPHHLAFSLAPTGIEGVLPVN